MKVFLVQDVKGLGRKGDIKDVPDGYARNFLLARKIAVILTDSQTKIVLTEKKTNQQVALKAKQDLQEKIKNLDGKVFTFTSKADKNGQLYGSIGPKELASEICVEEKMIHDHFKKLGEYTLTLKFNDELSANVKVVIKNEK
jgi:large subunit ribosomal protein L9